MPERPKLNPAQEKAVLATEGPVLILAGAGAGKTRVIVERIRHIIKSGVAPEAILAITFTNKAAGEMRERIAASLQGSTLAQGSSRSNLNTPFVSTFHALGLYLLKAHHKLLGYKRTPAVYDRAESQATIKKVLKEAGLEEYEPKMVLGTISRLKGEGTGVEELTIGNAPYERAVGVVWPRYEARLRQEGAVDFDDLLLRAVELLRHTEVREHYQKQWRYLLVDEYQDTNKVQALLIDLLLNEQKNICVVGDEDQTIYTWRGATIENIQSFERKYGAQYILLDKNYRSTQKILEAAKAVITRNENRKDKAISTDNAEGAQVGIYQAFDEEDEAGFVARIIGEQLARGVRPKDIAVLYRANFQSRVLEKAMLDSNIPYQVLGTRFFERKEVKDALAYVRAALYSTPMDIERASKTPSRGIGAVTLLKMLRGESAGAKAEQFLALMARIQEYAAAHTPAETIKYVITESGMEKMYREDKFEGTERLLNLGELVALANRHSDIEDFLGAVALASEQDEIKEERDVVRLMTIHASKGLEFDTVFITGLEEGLFPMSHGSMGEDKEEERRLMYVALTRAAKKLYLTYASYRTVFGQKNPTLPSQFLSDIPGDLLELEMPERLGKTIYLD